MNDALFTLTYSPLTWWVAYAIALAIGINYLPNEDGPRTSEKAAQPVDPTTIEDDQETRV